MWLTRLSITRPVTILMLVLALVILGLQSRSRLPVDLFPKIDFPMLFISTVYPGTGPEEIETLITKPIEDQVSTISGLKKLSSTSSEGVSTIVMEFEIGTNLDEVTSDVRSKLDILRSTLPEDAKAPMVIKADVGAMPVISLSISSDRRSPMDVRKMADDVLKDRLSQLPGVASVSVSGGEVREIKVEVDQNRLQAYGLSINQIVGAMQAENLNLPSGSIEEARRTSAIRVMGEFTSPEQIQGVRIPNALGNPNLTIGDVATVTDSVVEASSYTRVKGGASVALTVQKQSDANTVRVADEVRKELETLTGRPGKYTEQSGLQKFLSRGQKAKSAILPSDYDVTVAMDQSTFIKETLHDVYTSLFEGALLAIVIVFLFLHSIRGTFIIALAIPTSMIATFLVMDMAGFSINMMSMLGLSLCVGILVDDSIVVLENIHRHLRMGEPPREAAINGRTEIGLAAMTITMVDVVVFVPVAFMGGIVGQFFRQFGIVVAAATLFSLFISFTLTPMLASRWLKSHEAEEEEEKRQHEHPGLFRRFTDAWERGYNRVDATYRGLLAWALDHRAVVILLGIMIMLTSFATAKGQSFPISLGQVPQLLMALVIMLPVYIIAALIAFGWTFGMRMLIENIDSPPARLVFSTLRFIINAVLLFGGLLVVFGLGKVIRVGVPTFAFLTPVVMLAAIAFALHRPVAGAVKNDRAKTGRLLAAVSLVLIGICVLIPSKFLFEFSPKTDRRQFTVTIEHEVGTSLDVTDASARMVETAMLDPKQYPETKTLFTSVGSSGGGMFSSGGSSSDKATINVELVDKPDLNNRVLMALGLRRKSNVRSTEAVMTAINRQFSNIPGVKITAAEAADQGPGGAPISIEVSGPSTQRTQQVAEQIQEIVKATKGTYGTQLSSRQGRPEVQARIDRDRAAQYGISVAQIASALRTSLEGDTSTKYREGGKEYDIRVFLPESERSLVSQVPSMVVGTSSSGRPVYLYEVVKLGDALGPAKVERVDRQRSVTVEGQLLSGYGVGGIQQEIDGLITKKIDTSGVTVSWSGQAEMMTESFVELRKTLLLSITLVFMLMASLFESLLLPLIIMLAVPQALAGGIFALTFTQMSLSIVTMIGFIMLVGLVTKNAILMVDYTNTLRKEHGMDRRAALLEAGPTRLRPILMTTLAMVFGMTPTAIALSKGGEFRQPMAVAVIGGLLLSLFLTLVMVPAFYEIMDDLAQRIGALKDRTIGKLGG